MAGLYPMAEASICTGQQSPANINCARSSLLGSLAAFKFSIDPGLKNHNPILFGKSAHPGRFFYFKK
jgi:hypothetical protein